ncbi:hypothetical protein LM601614_40142 [Listeria monocytogenes]|uniref:hypothetical protein n=1 Tax=Listeria monocytogenes TaxID=1639 RepID=UPI00074D6A72|nr:hypothetical protein [Listeria monocytogenes]AVU89056.1 hypothetical protein C0Z06_03385 [Listeria monocytogenes]PDG65953.1 hypothetical protein AWL42_05485 [Listeria monocytogenes]CUK79359.1 hypothetical protein LM601614_40142 [Listeria monocytogenes]HCY9089812.1 hypothetical protein [Listeria monocytogenes]
MGVITVMLKSGDVRHFEVNDTEKALIICETGWVEIVTDENISFVFSNDEIAYFHKFVTMPETIAGESGVYAVLEKDNGECGLYELSEFKFKNKAKEGTIA